MARTRLELSKLLREILGSDNVYFRQPSSNMHYPCIKYDLVDKEIRFADDIVYMKSRRWTVIVIDEDPDSEIPERLETLPYCTFDRSYQSDGLNHFVYNLYF